MLQVVERGVARPEVVDAEPHPHPLQRLQRVDVIIRPLHDDALGELQLQRRGTDPGLGHDARHRLQEVRLPELPAGDVHRHLQVAARLAPPGGHEARLAQHHLPQLEDEPRRFGDRDELVGANGPELGALPAQERLRPGGRRVLQLPLGLVVQEELPAGEPLAHAVLQRHAAHVALVHLAGEELVPPLPMALGLVHGGVGAAKERLHVAAVPRVEGDADTGAPVDLLPVDQKRLPEERLQPLGHRRGRFLLAVDHDDELVPAQPRQRVGAADGAGKAPRHLLQELVPHLVAARVVQVLEVVQVEKEQRQRAPLAPGQGERLVQPVHEERPVRQVRGGVVVGEMLDPPLAVLPVGDVLAGGDHPEAAPAGASDRRRGELHRELGAVLADVQAFALPKADAGGVQAGRGGAARRGRQDAGVPPQEFPGLVAVHLALGVVGVDDLAVEVADGDPGGNGEGVDGLLQHPEAVLVLLKLGHARFESFF